MFKLTIKSCYSKILSLVICRTAQMEPNNAIFTNPDFLGRLYISTAAYDNPWKRMEKEADMNKLTVIARIYCVSGYEQFYDWATEKTRPTGIEPPALNEHIKGQVMETLEYLDQIAMPERLSSTGVRTFVIREIEHFETHGIIRHSC